MNRPSDEKIYRENEKDISDESLALSESTRIIHEEDERRKKWEERRNNILRRLRENHRLKDYKEKLWECYQESNWNETLATSTFLNRHIPYKLRKMLGTDKVKFFVKQLWADLRKEMALSGKMELLTSAAVGGLLSAMEDAGEIEDTVKRSYAKANVAAKIIAMTKGNKPLVQINNNNTENTMNVTVEGKVGSTEDELQKIADECGVTLIEAKRVAAGMYQRKTPQLIEMKDEDSKSS